MTGRTPVVVHVVGARPNFPKAAPVLRAVSELAASRGTALTQRLLHTGQHYDDALSGVFLRQLGLPEPDLNLGVGAGSHATQTAAVMIGLEQALTAERPDLVVVYGDVNSTLAAALVCAKLQIRLAHVEAGLRSFDPGMPEEVNRLVTDRLADLHLVTSADAIAHLAAEGVPAERIHLVGNPMIDTLLAHLEAARALPVPPERPTRYLLATVHRPSNVDAEEATRALTRAMHAVADQIEVLLPLHPRGRERLAATGLTDHPSMHVVDPLGYQEFLACMAGAVAVVTDSGGVQEETTVLGVPCLTLRANTERPVTISHGTSQLVTPDRLAERVREVLAAGPLIDPPVPPLWDGAAGPRIARVLLAGL